VRGVSERAVRRVLYPLTAGIVLSYFLFFTGRSAAFYFDDDDMLNLYMAWHQPLGELVRSAVEYWSAAYRPLGALFYRTVFAAAGFHPLPFRIVCLTIGAANIGLCFWFIRLVTGSLRTAALACLIFAYQPRLIEIWYRTATVYDLLCFTFVYTAACLYIDARRRGVLPGGARAAAIAISYVCALDMKEVAVALPVILLAYELLFARGAWKRLWLIALLVVMTLPYVYGKTHGASELARNPLYAQQFTWSRFAESWTIYLQYLLVADGIRPWVSLAVLGGTLAVALLFRSRKMLFAWIVAIACTLPVSFIPARGGYALYLSWAGWVLYAAVAMVAVQDAITSRTPHFRTALACCVFVLVGWRLGKLSLHDLRNDRKPWLYVKQDLVRGMASQMRVLHPAFPRGARVLFVEDAFGTDEWTPYFVVKLLYDDDTLVVDRIKMMDRKPADWAAYQYVFTYERGAWRQLKPG